MFLMIRVYFLIVLRDEFCFDDVDRLDYNCRNIICDFFMYRVCERFVEVVYIFR